MNQFIRRILALPMLLILATAIAAPTASAHSSKSSSTSGITALQLLFGALAVANASGESGLHLKLTPPKGSKGHGHHHSHGHSHHSHSHAPAPTLLKVHADLCVSGTSWLNARLGPSTQHRVVAKLSKGERVHVRTCQSTNHGKSYWCKIDLGYGQTAHVSATYLDACHYRYYDD